MSSSTITGRRPGSVMCHSRRQRLAPSAAAASYSAGLMVLRAARNTIIPQPASFQTACAVTRRMKLSGLVIRSTAWKPLARRLCASSPAPPIICWNSDTTSTHEKKCGR
jgi:hypothetical protein